MTPFLFFVAAVWILLGVLCFAVAAVIVYSVVIGIRNHASKRRNKEEQ